MSVAAKIPAEPAPKLQEGEERVPVVRDEKYLISILRGLAHNRGLRVAWAEPLLELLKSLKRQAVAGEQALKDADSLRAELQRRQTELVQLRVKLSIALAKRAAAQHKLNKALARLANFPKGSSRLKP